MSRIILPKTMTKTTCTVIAISYFMGLGSGASPPSQAETLSWTMYEIKEFGLKFKLPKTFKEKKWQVIVGNAQTRTYHAGKFTIVDFDILEAPNLDRAKMGRQRNYSDYQEWTKIIAGHRAIVQSFVAEGEIFSEKGILPSYNVAVACELDTNRVLTVKGSTATEEEQEEIFAMLETFE